MYVSFRCKPWMPEHPLSLVSGDQTGYIPVFILMASCASAALKLVIFCRPFQIVNGSQIQGQQIKLEWMRHCLSANQAAGHFTLGHGRARRKAGGRQDGCAPNGNVLIEVGACASYA